MNYDVKGQFVSLLFLNINRPSVLKFIEVVQTRNTLLLIKLSIYCIKDLLKEIRKMFFIIVLSEVCLFKVECFFHKTITFSHVCMLIIMYLIVPNY